MKQTCLYLPGIYYMSNLEAFYFTELYVMCKTNLVWILQNFPLNWIVGFLEVYNLFIWNWVNSIKEFPNFLNLAHMNFKHADTVTECITVHMHCQTYLKQCFWLVQNNRNSPPFKKSFCFMTGLKHSSIAYYLPLSEQEWTFNFR
jgi:hypothetical protein